MAHKNIYIVISRTPTKFGRCIRWFGRIQYNHAAIGLDEELRELYAFARPQHHAIFLGHLVRETLERYTLRRNHSVPVVVFRLSVSQEEYNGIRNMIQRIFEDSEYMYNLFSVLTYPFTKGFATYKCYTCTEFVFHVLNELGYPLKHPEYRYKPDDLLKLLKPQIVYEGDLREYMVCSEKDDNYFSGLTLRLMYRNLNAMMKIMGRTYFLRKKAL